MLKFQGNFLIFDEAIQRGVELPRMFMKLV